MNLDRFREGDDMRILPTDSAELAPPVIEYCAVCERRLSGDDVAMVATECEECEE